MILIDHIDLQDDHVHPGRDRNRHDHDQGPEPFRCPDHVPDLGLYLVPTLDAIAGPHEGGRQIGVVIDHPGDVDNKLPNHQNFISKIFA